MKSNLGIVTLAIGLMTVGQLPAGIYLPSMISMGSYFHVSHGMIQYILGLYLLTYGSSQLIYGPLSDHYGRKPVALTGLILFVFGSVICALSISLWQIYLGSIIEGFALGSVAVVSGAIVRDIYKDKRMLKAMGYKSAATIMTPLLAPIIGSYLQIHIGWRATYVFLICYAIIVFFIAKFFLHETSNATNHRENRLSLRNIMENYTHIFKTTNYLLFGACRVLIISGGTAYAANSPFLFQTLLHLNPVEYAWVSVIPASGFFIGSLLSNRIGKNYRIESIVFTGTLIAFAAGTALLLVGITGNLSILGIVLPMLLYMIGSGLIYPSSLTGAILPMSASIAGTATALIGSTQNLGRGIFSSLVGFLHDQTVFPLAITLCVLAAFSVISAGTLAVKRRARIGAE